MEELASLTETIAYPDEPQHYVSDLIFILFPVLGLGAALIDNLHLRRRRLL